MKDRLVKKNILGVGVTDASLDDILEYVSDILSKSKHSLSIVTPNPEIIMHAVSHEYYKDVLNRADIALCDGVGLFLAARLLGTPISERISGVDFMENLCRLSSEKAYTVGFLGGRDGVAERAAKCLVSKYPNLKVTFVAEEWEENRFARATQYKAGKREPRDSAPVDILFVAFGFPKQEEWIDQHLSTLPVRVMMGVGGAFDYLSGDVSRAPVLLRSLGLEWLYRLIRQPWRIQRQLALPKFLVFVIKEKFRKKK